jgi:hypothetical protein
VAWLRGSVAGPTPGGISDGQSDTETGFCASTSVSPVRMIAPLLHTDCCVIDGMYLDK